MDESRIDRVLVEEGGYAANPRSARERYGVVPDIIFIRRDGWTLGAPAKLEALAFKMWSDEWKSFMRRGDRHPRPIEEYRE
jgi:hypothetical protein